MFKKLSVKALRNLYPAGCLDTAALLAMAAGGVVAGPLLSPESIGSLPISVLTGLLTSSPGGAWWAHRYYDAVGGSPIFKSNLSINSSPPPIAIEAGKDWGGVLLGYTVDTGKPIVVPWDDWYRHGSIVGQSGFGKSVLLEWIMLQQIMHGGGLLNVDGKLASENLVNLRAFCAWAGREQDLLVINPGDPEFSNLYNPVLFGDPDEVSARCLSLIPSSESNPGTDYYRQAANQGLATLVGAIQRTGLRYNFIDLTILLMNARALAWLESIVPKQSAEAKALSLFLDQYRIVDRQGVATIDVKRMKDTFGGIGGRLHLFGTGNFGQVCNTYSPDINLYEAIRQNKIVYVMLPTMGKKEAASNFGKMVIGDLRTAASWIQALPEHLKPFPPFLCPFDEAGSYVTPAFQTMFEQLRSAHITLLPAIQTKANLDAISEELTEMVVGNTRTKISFNIGTQATAEAVADLIGMEPRAAITVNLSTGGGMNTGSDPTNPGAGHSSTANKMFAERSEEVYKVSPDELKSLNPGEAIVSIGSKVYHIRVPKITVGPEWQETKGINRFRQKYERGLDLFRDVDKWLGQS